MKLRPKPAGRRRFVHLCNVGQVRDERERLDEAAADERLQQDVDLAVVVLHPSPDGQLAVLVQVKLELRQLVLPHLGQ